MSLTYLISPANTSLAGHIIMTRRCWVLGLLYLHSLGLTASSLAAPARDSYLHPDFQIAGMPKSGTSQMHLIMGTHWGVQPLAKEWCPKGPDSIPGYARDMTAAIGERRRAQPGMKTSSACINIEKALWYYEWVKEHSRQPLPNTPKFIYLMRDPAELLWARFNFWTTSGDVDELLPKRWTSKDSFRTPEYFHSIMEAQGRIHGSFNLTQSYLRDQLYFLGTLDKLISAAGRDNVLIVNSRDLEGPESRVAAFIQKLSRFTGLQAQGFARQIIRSRTNSGSRFDYRGHSNTVADFSSSQSGIYEVSGNRPMLPKTRALIYRRARGFCGEVKKKYGVVFHECLGLKGPALPSSPPQKPKPLSELSRGLVMIPGRLRIVPVGGGARPARMPQRRVTQ